MKPLSFLLGSILLVPGILFAQKAIQENPESGAIVATALDYAEGYYNGEPERMERAIHPDFNKVSLMYLPDGGDPIVYYSSWSALIAACNSKSGYLEPEKRKLGASVLYVHDSFACAKVTSSEFNDFLGLYKHDGHWKIYTVLWAAGPDSRFRKETTGCTSTTATDEIERAVRDAIEGIYTGNVELLQKVMHPEAKRVTPLVSRKTGEFFVIKDGASTFFAPTKAGMTMLDREKWDFHISVLDCMDDMSVVRFASAKDIQYIQLARIGDQWTILNILRELLPPPSAP